jgi:YegS/Rv2252/BmrU family lipid kinase
MNRSSERILLILNPSSGFISKDIAVALILKKLRRHFASVSLVNTASPLQASEITRQGLKHFDVFVAFGGDGTVNSVASSLFSSNKTLGILPGGSGNGLARNLGIPLSWLRALDTLISGQDVSIDTGRINGRHFFNVAGMGLDGLISKKFNLESRTRGILPYVYFALKGYLEMPQFTVRVTTESSEFEEDIMILALANFRQYGAKAIIAPHASPYDGLLDLCLLKKFKLLQSSLNVQRLFTGTIHKYPFYRTFKFERVHIRSLNGPIPFHFDGEYGGSEMEDYDVHVVPASMRVRIPQFRE